MKHHKLTKKQKISRNKKIIAELRRQRKEEALFWREHYKEFKDRIERDNT